MSNEENSTKKVNLFDTKTSKLEAGITLGGFIIGGLGLIVMADYGSVIIGINEATSVPSDVTEFVKNSGLALLAFILGSKTVVKD